MTTTPGVREARSSIRRHRGVAAASLVGAAALAVGAATGMAAAARPAGRVPAKTLAALRRRVAAAEAVPKFTAPGPKVSAKVLKNTSALVFPVNSEIGQCTTEATDFAALGKRLGMHVSVFSDSGNPTQWQTAIEDATSAHDSAIVMFCGIVPGAVAPQLKAAERQGIKVVDDNYNEVKNYQLLDAETAVNTAGGMVTDVADAIVNLRGEPLHALLVTSNSIVQGPASVGAVKHAIRTDCPKVCTLDQVITVPIQDWATQTQSDVSSAIQAHPDVNAVIVAFDGMTTFVDPAVQSSHRPGLHVYAWGGSAPAEKLLLAKHSVIAADAGLDPDWGAYGAMDQVIRLLAHKKPVPVAKEVNPNRLFVPSNVKQFFGPHFSYSNKGYGGNAFVNGFRKLWGLKPVGK